MDTMKPLVRKTFFWDAPAQGAVGVIANKGAINGR